jgi:hypothetical protein
MHLMRLQVVVLFAWLLLLLLLLPDSVRLGGTTYSSSTADCWFCRTVLRLALPCTPALLLPRPLPAL